MSASVTLPEMSCVSNLCTYVLKHLLRNGPVLEQVVADFVVVAVGSEVIVLLVLHEQHIGVACGRHVRDTVTGKEQQRRVSHFAVGQNTLRLVVPERIVRVTVHQLPRLASLLGIGELDIIRDDLNLVGILLPNEVREDGTNDGRHTRRDHNDRDVVGLGEGIELLESGVELDIAADKLLHLMEGVLDGLHHGAETVTETDALSDNLVVDLAARLVAHAHGVDHVVVRVQQRDRAVEVRQEHILRVSVLRVGRHVQVGDKASLSVLNPTRAWTCGRIPTGPA